MEFVSWHTLSTLRRRARMLNLRVHIPGGDDRVRIVRADGVPLVEVIGYEPAFAYLVGYAQGAGAERWEMETGERR